MTASPPELLLSQFPKGADDGLCRAKEISVGDTVLIKWKSGPIVARATVKRVERDENCTPARLKTMVEGFKLAQVEGYFTSLKSSFFGMAIFLTEEEWLDAPIEPNWRVSYASSWVVLKEPFERLQARSATPLHIESLASRGQSSANL